MLDQWIEVQIHTLYLFGGPLTQNGHLDGAAFLVALDVLSLTGVLDSETCRRIARLVYDASGAIMPVIDVEPARTELFKAIRAELQ